MHACVRIVYLYHITFINLFGYVFYVYFCSVTLLYLLVVAFLIFVRAFVYLYVISFLKPWVQRYIHVTRIRNVCKSIIYKFANISCHTFSITRNCVLLSTVSIQPYFSSYFLNYIYLCYVISIQTKYDCAVLFLAHPRKQIYFTL